MYIFLGGNSNIHYAGLNHVRPILKLSAPKELYRTYFEGLLNLVSTDHVLQLALLRSAMDNPNTATIALLTGDGAGINSGEGFWADAKRLAARGWEFEVYSWDIACHSQLKGFAEQSGKYYKLEDYYNSKTFIKNQRYPSPLSNSDLKSTLVEVC